MKYHDGKSLVKVATAFVQQSLMQAPELSIWNRTGDSKQSQLSP